MKKLTWKHWLIGLLVLMIIGSLLPKPEKKTEPLKQTWDTVQLSETGAEKILHGMDRHRFDSTFSSIGFKPLLSDNGSTWEDTYSDERDITVRCTMMGKMDSGIIFTEVFIDRSAEGVNQNIDITPRARQMIPAFCSLIPDTAEGSEILSWALRHISQAQADTIIDSWHYDLTHNSKCFLLGVDRSPISTRRKDTK